LMRGGRYAREDRVSLVEFLIIQREFRLAQSRWENVEGAYEFIARFDCTPVMANPTTIAQRFNAGLLSPRPLANLFTQR